MKAFLYLVLLSPAHRLFRSNWRSEKKNTSRFQFDHDKSYGIFEDKKIMLERKGVRMGDYLFLSPPSVWMHCVRFRRGGIQSGWVHFQSNVSGCCRVGNEMSVGRINQKYTKTLINERTNVEGWDYFWAPYQKISLNLFYLFLFFRFLSLLPSVWTHVKDQVLSNDSHI